MDYKKGIDVSKWQGDIDWEKAKADGVEFVMIRAGYGQNNIDEKFKRNADECTRLGIPFGIYWFSYAYTVDMAVREAQYAVEAVKPYKLAYPIAFDFEYDSVDYATKKGVTISKTLASAMTRAFCEQVEAAGYIPMVYANLDYLSRYFDANIPNEYDVWLAQWPKTANLDNPPAQATCIWQYTSSGTVDGISGRVDMNAAYKAYGEEDLPWYAADLQWGVNTGITDGTRPDDAITRAETVVMLHRLYKLITN
jgi:GH25 family lysozyme M1 (1,4-beta-N-acetylmuramidase)